MRVFTVVSEKNWILLKNGGRFYSLSELPECNKNDFRRPDISITANTQETNIFASLSRGNLKSSRDTHVNDKWSDVHVVVQFYRWFKFIFFCFKLIIIHYLTKNKRK